MSEGRFEGVSSSKYQQTSEKKSNYLNPFDLLEGEGIDVYLEKRKKIPSFALTQPVSNLARSEEAADFMLPDLSERLLVYPKTKADDEAYDALDIHNIPQFTRETAHNPGITAVKIPLNAWRLDSTDFQEEEPTFPAGNGAIEIMTKLGVLLGRIHADVKALPADFKLCQAAFVVGSSEFIKLVPPYSLSGEVTAEDIVQRIGKELNAIDPSNLHENQIKAFEQALKKTSNK